MIMVKKQKGESDDKLINRFRKKIIESGVLITMRKKERFVSKSEKRKEKKYKLKHIIELEKARETV